MKNIRNSKVSIIVPIYNVEKYITKCIKSILGQTYKNIEVILVNDGSKDNCKVICEEFKKKDDRVILINKENSGVSSARNVGLDMATGEYVLFVDGDDYIHESTIEIIVEKAISSNADIVHFNFQSVDQDGNEIKVKNKDLDDNKLLTSYETICEYVKAYKIKVMPWGKLYKLNLFKGLRYDEGYVYEDELIFPKIIYKSNINYTINDKLYYYVNAPNSITKSSITKNKLDSKKFMIKSLEEFYLDTYPDLMSHIYMANCLNCIGTIKQIKLSDKLENKNKEIIHFKELYLDSYTKMKKYKIDRLIPLKKRIFNYLYYLLIKGRKVHEQA